MKTGVKAMNDQFINIRSLTTCDPDQFITSLKAQWLVYLAAPYSDQGKKTVRSFIRYELTTRVFAKLLEAGVKVFSPLNHTHPVSLVMTGEEYPFLKLDYPILCNCSAMVVLTFPGWEESHGIAQELKWFMPYQSRSWLNKGPVYLFDPYTGTVGRLHDYTLEGVNGGRDDRRESREAPKVQG